jgi:hypothetical protein
MAYNPNNPNGQATMANSEPVVIASDQSALPVSDNGGSLTIDGSVSVSNFPATQNVSVTNASIPVTDNGGSLTVDGSVTVSGTVTANAGTGTMNVSVQNASIPVTDDGGSLTIDGSVSVSNFPATQPVSGTVTANAGTGTMNVSVQNASIPVTDNGGSLTVDGSVSVSNFPATQPVSGTITASNTSGDVAHDSPDSGNPVKVGFQAESTSFGTAVANGDRVNGIADVFGRQLVGTIDASMQVWKSANYTTTQTGASMWTPASGKKIAITYLAISSYATTAGRVLIWFGAAGDTTYTAGTDQLVWAGSFAPSTNSRPGAIIQLPFGITAVTADHQLRITTDAAISLDVTIYGYEC